MRRGISLSTLTQLVVAALVVVPLIWVSLWLSPMLAQYFTSARATSGYDLRVSKRLITYRLRPRKTVTFAFSKPLTLFRVLSCAALTPGTQDKEGGWVYGYRVELLDVLGKTIGTHDIYSRSVVRDRENQEEDKVRFYRGATASITLDENAVITSDRPAAMVRLSPLASDPDIAGIDARVYERRPFIGSSALATFRRRSPEEKIELAAANAFPADMLTPQEMTNIARNQWRPIGPIGIEGPDYTMRVMYEHATPRQTKEGKGK